MRDELSAIVTRRTTSLFQEDVDAVRSNLVEVLRDKRILVIGGAGSIGSATVRELIRFPVEAIHVVDQDENLLAELVRGLNSSGVLPRPGVLRTIPLNLASPVMRRLIQNERPYSAVLNFAALKHVRSEKDCYSLLHMLDTNVLQAARLLRQLAERGGTERYFSVSTDKAAEPVNLMGASKRLMEHVLFSEEIVPVSSFQRSSARFANVAFSHGSLLESFCNRLVQRQPISVPDKTQRFFVSLVEAGQICLIAAFSNLNQHIVVPRLGQSLTLQNLQDVAIRFLQHHGYSPRFYTDEAAARIAVNTDLQLSSYPLLVTPLNTAGEKPFEQFVGPDETAVDIGLRQLEAIRYHQARSSDLLPLLTTLDGLVQDTSRPVTKEVLVREIYHAVPELRHRDSELSLDDRM